MGDRQISRYPRGERGGRMGRWFPSMSWQDDFFDPFFADPFSVMPFPGRGRENRVATHMPRCDLTETDDAYALTAELPGVNKEDISVVMSPERVLTIKAGQKSDTTDTNEEGEEGPTYHYRERREFSFTRSFTLPSNIDRSQMTAEMEGGVLHVTIPKAEVPADTQVVEIK
ncbi:small heat shock protein HSP20 [Kipferlia bialata]|uniref:Small heat shock protein HSP20 n=1 Tax=Kipferlia bialata TaxID=797122 RepID=A0A9K3CTV4_9EUKA|nr:small heat shock protein HSP20 [Kipferlia bialata]|eukprot:g3711.t1